MDQNAEQLSSLAKAVSRELDTIVRFVEAALLRDPAYAKERASRFEYDTNFSRGLPRPLRIPKPLDFTRGAKGNVARDRGMKSSPQDPSAGILGDIETKGRRLRDLLADYEKMPTMTQPSAVPVTTSAATPTPIWAWASALIAILTAGLSFAPLTTFTLAVLGIGTVAIAAITASGIGRSSTRRWYQELLGMAPALIFVGFACVYGAIALLDGPMPAGISYDGAQLQHLRDPLVLSFSLFTTADRLDIDVHDWVRSVAYIEMLLLAGIAGQAVILTTRWAKRSFNTAITTIESQREGPSSER